MPGVPILAVTLSLVSTLPLESLNSVCLNNDPVSCFDVRVQPTAFFGLKPGDANVLNNAGGRVDSDAIRSLIVLDSIAGVGTVIVVHHTDCGLTHSTDEAIKKLLKDKAPLHAREIEGMKFGEIIKWVRILNG